MKHPASYISDHLLVWVTLAFITGIGFSPQIRFENTSHTFFAAALIVFLFLLIFLHRLGKSQTLICLLIPFFVAIGMFYGFRHLQLPADKQHIYNRINEKTEVVLIGTMATIAGFDGRTSKVVVQAENIRLRDDPKLLPTKGKVLLRLQGPWPKELSPGDRLVIRVHLKRPNSYKTPGSFDYAQYLARRDLWITGFVQTPLFLHRLEKKSSLLHTLHYLPEKIRDRIGQKIDEAVPAKHTGVYRAILIGDRTRVKEELLETFKGSGTVHILAISGLHMAVIGTLLYVSLYWLLSRSEKLLLRFSVQKWAAFLSLPVLVGYGFLAGMNTPVFRAVIMSSIVIVSICTDRKKSPSSLLAFAALLILSMDPLQLFSVSFQLSFAAVAGILFLLPLLTNLLFEKDDSTSPASLPQQVINWGAAGLLVSLVATLATVPIALHSFNRFSTVGPIANLLVEPLICLWSLPAGFLSIPFIFLQPELSTFLLQIGALGLDVATRTTAFFSSFSFSTIWLPTPPAWLLATYYLALVLFSLWGWKTKNRILGFTLCVLLIFVPFVHPPNVFHNKESNSFRLTYLDVGQGSATLLEYPGNYRVLIDGGGSSFGKTTVGERVIAPYLWQKGVRKLDAIAITHPDADHYNGLSFILEHFSPKTLWLRDTNGHDAKFRELVQMAEKRNISVITPETGQHLREDTGQLQCIANLSGNQDTDTSPRWPNSGLVLKACSKQLCALFPGDIGMAAERWVVENSQDLGANLLLAPHHGSATSNSSEFLFAVSPEFMIVSASGSAQTTFPHKRVRQECAKQQINLISTGRHGTIKVIADNEGYRIFGQTRPGNNPHYPFEREMLAEKRTVIQKLQPAKSN